MDSQTIKYEFKDAFITENEAIRNSSELSFAFIYKDEEIMINSKSIAFFLRKKLEKDDIFGWVKANFFTIMLFEFLFKKHGRDVIFSEIIYSAEEGNYVIRKHGITDVAYSKKVFAKYFAIEMASILCLYIDSIMSNPTTYLELNELIKQKQYLSRVMGTERLRDLPLFEEYNRFHLANIATS